MIPTHVHIKTGNKYQLLFITNRESSLSDFIEQAVYIDDKGALWSRQLTQFNERFKVLDD